MNFLTLVLTQMSHTITYSVQVVLYGCGGLTRRIQSIMGGSNDSNTFGGVSAKT